MRVLFTDDWSFDGPVPDSGLTNPWHVRITSPSLERCTFSIGRSGPVLEVSKALMRGPIV